MARKNKKAAFQKFVVVCSVLVVAEAAFLFFYPSHDEANTPREAITKALKAQGDLSPDRKEKMRVQLALADFYSANAHYPSSLNELVPTYFDAVPDDPETNAPFQYAISNGRYQLGVQKAPVVTAEVKLDPSVIASLEAHESERASFIYDPTGKRDPFQPFDLSPKVQVAGKTELEMFTIGQLRYTSYLGGLESPIGLVENAARRGYPVRKGTKIGPNGGVVVDILPTKIVILETKVDPITGQKDNVTLELDLRPKGKDEPN